MKYLTIFGVSLGMLFQVMNGQPVDIMVRNINQYELREDGTPSEQWFTCIQQTYDKNNHLVLERFFDKIAKKQESFTWYYYDTTGRLKSKETYHIDRNPKALKQILYNDAGDTVKIVEYSGNQGEVAKVSEKSFIYSASGQLLQTRTQLTTGKVIENAKFIYKKGLKSPARINVVNNSDSPYKEKVTMVYHDSTGLLYTLVRQMTVGKQKEKFQFTVTYNIKGKPVEERTEAAGKLLKRRIYEYAADVELIKYYDQDGDGKKTGLYMIETYFHKANLDAKSYFENQEGF
jgi:hypothetical protein